MKWNLMGSAGGSPNQIQRGVLALSALVLLLIALLGHSPVLARYEQRRTYQESPLSPVATPLTASLTTSQTTPLTTTFIITESANLTTTAAATVTTVFTSPLATPSTTTLTAVMTAPTMITATLPVTTPAPAPVELINRGQTSLLLVGAVLGGILVVVAIVLGRQR